MTVYNFNLGIGWASSGVEYAQVYRAQSFRRLGVDAKFIFTDFITQTNVEELTKNIGFHDDEVIWLYQYFTDFPIAPTTYTLEELQQTFTQLVQKVETQGTQVKFRFGPDAWALAYLKSPQKQVVERVEYVTANNLVRKDFFTSGRWMSEFFIPVNQVATCIQRTYFNQDGTVAFEELLDGDAAPIYRFKDQVLRSKEALVSYFVRCLQLTHQDVVIIDRATGLAQEILENRGGAHVGGVIHADHFSAPNTNDDYILWNNYYEYLFQHVQELDFLVTATKSQRQLLLAQFEKYNHQQPKIVTIPVGSLDQLRHPTDNRRPFSIMTASRLASEKHLDWLTQAVIQLHQEVPAVSLDIYGEGPQREPLQKIIQAHHAGDYIHLRGHQNLTDVYQHYQVYGSASTSEGFGLTLMEAVGSGLAMVGFDVRYGNQTFIENDRNGVLLPDPQDQGATAAVASLVKGLHRVLCDLDPAQLRAASYQLAGEFLQAKVAKKWQALLAETED